LDAQGVVLDGDASSNPDLICEMLSRHGIKNARIEVGWNNVGWEDESGLVSNDDLKKKLLACQKHHIRPLILLNANSGAPGPTRFFDRILAAPAHKGDRQILLTDIHDLIVGHSGIRNLTDYRASEVLITGISGNTVQLSKPLPKDLGDIGAKVEMSTLKYRPFGPPETSDYQTTLAAWQRYVDTVGRNVTTILGTQGMSDLGFDMEIWNELSFGSSFLDLNAYYEPKFAKYDESAVWSAVVKATVAVANEHPSQFRGVRFIDGFRNTIPWPASSTEPSRVSAMSSHPYPPHKHYPQDEQHPPSINSLGEVDTTGFVPTYDANFPEYGGTLLQTETVVRDMGPLTTPIYNTLHGLDARKVNDAVLPCPLWFTEFGFDPPESGIKDQSAALQIKAKVTARSDCFYINKGLERLYFFSALSGDSSLGVVQDNFVAYAKTHYSYPLNDKPYTSPMLQTIGRMVDTIEVGLDSNFNQTRTVSLESVGDTHNHTQFVGDGTPAHPNLYNRDVFTFLPFQVNAHKFVLAYYVMTRDVTKSLAPEQYTVKLKGLHAKGARMSSYDPIRNVSVAVHPIRVTDNEVTLSLAGRDYPTLLIFQERTAN
jgi:hypothetical protein